MPQSGYRRAFTIPGTDVPLPPESAFHFVRITHKRVSRIAANIPFVKTNLSPLSFTDVPRGLYTDAILGVYELNRVDLLRDVFIWAYERSAARYAAVRQSLGEPDPFRLRHRDALRTGGFAAWREVWDTRDGAP